MIKLLGLCNAPRSFTELPLIEELSKIICIQGNSLYLGCIEKPLDTGGFTNLLYIGRFAKPIGASRCYFPVGPQKALGYFIKGALQSPYIERAS